MWNSGSGSGGGYGGPPGFPDASSYPGAPGGYGPPPGAPPGGFPAPLGGFPAPLGEPPMGFPAPPGGGYSPGYAPTYAPPPGPPGFPGYGAPPGPPPSGYPPPMGAPPSDRGYPGQQFRQSAPSTPQYGGGYPGQQAQGPPPPPPSQEQHYGPRFMGANHQTQQPFFQYSQCSGKKKALCIGINYTGQSGELRGCINDAQNIQRFLCTHFGYKTDDIVMLTDDARNPRQIPTKENIITAMQWLVRDARPNDSLFFHYSGHGGQTKDTDGDEGDGFDEVIYPVDYEKKGHIVDDLMHTIMVKPLPPGCRLTAIFDSCHSGSALDLPYVYSTEGKVKEPNLAAEAGQGLLSAVSSYAKGDMGGVMSSAMGIFKTATGNTQKAGKKTRDTKTSPADVISWSGCKDSQTSADTQEAGKATGAMSFAFMSCLGQNPKQSYQQLLVGLRGILKSKYSQKPQLASSHPMDTSIMFIC